MSISPADCVIVFYSDNNIFLLAYRAMIPRKRKMDLHGTLYLTSNFVCFHARVFGSKTKVLPSIHIPIYSYACGLQYTIHFDFISIVSYIFLSYVFKVMIPYQRIINLEKRRLSDKKFTIHIKQRFVEEEVPIMIL